MLPPNFGDLSRQFPPMIAKLIIYSYEQGYQLVFGPPTSFTLTLDLMLFRNGEFLDLLSAYRAIGEYWEGLGGLWQGRINSANKRLFSMPIPPPTP